ncbi:MAG: hypothetical protein NUV51_06660 [Sulfuricaulis sp.]|nr:hypothetical protein [Sulfuricaulis sp.]
MDDMLIAVVVARENGATVTMTGWNPYFNDLYPSEEFRASIYWRIATSASSDPNTITQTGTCDSLAGQIARFSGVDTASPFETSPILAANWVRQNSDNIDTGTENTTSPTAMLLVAAMIRDNGTVTEGGGWSQSFDSSLNISRDTGISLHYQLQATAGAKSISNWALSSGSDPNYGVIFALRPAPTSSVSLTINVPTGTVARDVMIASVARTSSAVTITPPSGWTQIREVTQTSATSSALATYYRVAGASEPASYTWTMSVSGFGGAVGGIASFSGVDNTVPPYDAEAGNATASSTSHMAPSVTTTLDDGMLVTIHELTSSRTWTFPGGMTEVVDVASLTPSVDAGISMEINYEVRTSAGATNTRTATVGGHADSGAVQSISLRPTPLVCWSDNFNRANGPPGSDWIVSNSGGTFGDPVIFSNRLRMTNTAGNLATMAKLQRLFPGAGNRIEVEFEHFAYGGSGADGIAVTFSDSTVAPAPGAYGGSLGYAQRSTPSVVNGFAGGWLGVGMDEYGNFSNPTEGRQGGPGFFVDSVSIRGSGSGTTGYTYHAGTGTLTPQVDNNGAASPPHKYRIIVDHSNAVNAFVSVERNTGAGYVSLVAPYDAKAQAGQAAVPTSWLLSYTGSSGGSTNIHEIDSLRICATSQSSLSGVDHFEITVSASASTCVPQTVTIVAKDSSNNTLTAYTGTVTLSTSSAHGTWAKSTSAPIPQGTLTPGADNGAATYTFVAGDNGSIVLTLDNQRAEDLTATVVDSTVPTSSRTSSTVSYLDNAFVVSPTDALGTTPVAGRDHAMKAELWRCTRVNPTTCNNCSIASGYGGAKNLDAWYTADTDHPTGANAPVIGSLTLPNSAPAVNPASNNLTTLSFTNGVANFNLITSDVGKYVLNLRDDTRTFATTVDILGASSTLTVRPFALHIDVTGNTGNNAATGSIVTSAGTNFTATVRGILWESGDDSNNDGVHDSGADLSNNGATLRYAWDTVVSATTPFTPATPSDTPVGTGTAGTLDRASSPGSGTIAQASFGSGSAAPTDWRYSEVGSFTIRGTATDYLNSGINLQTNNGVVGRFTPAYFDVAVTATCGPVGTRFTYSEQPFSNVAVTARAKGGATTTNYRDFGSGVIFSKDTTISDANSGTGTFTNATLLAADFVSGVRNELDVTYTLPNPAAPGLRKETVPWTLKLRATDTDSVSSNYTGITEPNAEIRSGRLRIFNAYGSELVALSLPMRVEYFSSDGWVKNDFDTCTALDGTILDLTNNVHLPPPGLGVPTIKIKNPASTTTVTVVSPLPLTGVGALSFTAPMAEGYADARMDLPARTWLRFDWDGNNSEEDPTGRATFGLYRGSPRHIYQRERY